MRVLFYNWVDYLDAEKRGGGVSIYQRNVMAALQDRKDVNVSFLTAGLSYDLPSKRPRWEALRHGNRSRRAQHYEIINSGVLAPAHHSFGNPAQVDHPETQKAFFDFIEETGPYDVVHFNNIEGLPVSVLSLKKRWPMTKVVLSLHNYYPFCPQVNLWYQERKTCEDFDGGNKCTFCLTGGHDANHIRLANGLAYRLKRRGVEAGSLGFHLSFVLAMRYGRSAVRLLRRVKSLFKRNTSVVAHVSPTQAEQARKLSSRRRDMVETINQHCDLVLCVSDAVRELAVRYGLRQEICVTNYIGTQQAEAFANTKPRTHLLRQDGTVSLGFLGYMRRDKGFMFLLEALETLPKEHAKRVRFTAAARAGEGEAMARLSALNSHLAEVTHMDGYSHDDLDDLLADIDVGVVPVLWHDNLPQVAIELHSRHIPLLTADMGGAKELGNCPEMTFTAGDIDAFHARIAAILDNRIDMDAYWYSARPPTTMDTHINELIAHYASG